MRFCHPATRSLALALVLTGLMTFGFVVAAAAATKDAPASTAQRIGTVCAKRASRAATSARRGALQRRCVNAMNQAAASRRRGSADVTAPTVSWITPTSGATVSGTISGPACEVNASDDRAVVKVVMKVDGTTLNTESD